MKMKGKPLDGDQYSATKYNYLVAPMGTKAQTVGIYRAWRHRRNSFTVMYASPTEYRKKAPSSPPGRTWVIERTDRWISEVPTRGAVGPRAV